jgi:hypothetical protein
MRPPMSWPSPATILAAVALFVALGLPAWASPLHPAAPPKPNVRLATAEFTVSNGGLVEAKAACKGGTRVFSGGYASTSQHTRFIAVGPARGSNSFLAYAVQPPVNINTGVGRETATITVVALCAPAGEPVVFAGKS